MSQGNQPDRSPRGPSESEQNGNQEQSDRLVAERSQWPNRSVQQAAARANAARQQAGHALGSAASTLRQQAGTLPGGQPVGGVLQLLEQQVREQPLAALGLAFLAGLVLGRLTD